MKKYVFYFSPTGGTRFAAVELAKAMGADEIDITVRCLDMSLQEEDVAIFFFPVYAGRIPVPMRERLSHIKASGTSAILVACYGNRAVEDALLEMSDRVKAKGFRTIGGAEIVTPHAFNPEVGKFRPDEGERRQLLDFVNRVLAKPVKNEVQMPGDPAYKDKKPAKLPLYPKAAKECIGCGICFNNCPMKAISEVKMKVNKKACISCMRCIDMCSTSSRHLPKSQELLSKGLAFAMAGLKKNKPKFYM